MSEIMIIVGGRVCVRRTLTAENAPHVAAVLKQYLPEIVRREGAVAVAIEKDGVTHVVQARRKDDACR